MNPSLGAIERRDLEEGGPKIGRLFFLFLASLGGGRNSPQEKNNYPLFPKKIIFGKNIKVFKTVQKASANLRTSLSHVCVFFGNRQEDLPSSDQDWVFIAFFFLLLFRLRPCVMQERKRRKKRKSPNFPWDLPYENQSKTSQCYVCGI